MATNTTPFNHQYYNNQYPSSYYNNDANKTDCTFAPPISSYSDGFEPLTSASIACEQKHQPGYNRNGIHETSSNLTTSDLGPLESLNWDQTNTANCSILNATNQQHPNNSSTIDYLTHTEQFYQYDNRHDCSGYGTFTDNNVVF